MRIVRRILYIVHRNHNICKFATVYAKFPRAPTEPANRLFQGQHTADTVLVEFTEAIFADSDFTSIPPCLFCHTISFLLFIFRILFTVGTYKNVLNVTQVHTRMRGYLGKGKSIIIKSSNLHMLHTET